MKTLGEAINILNLIVKEQGEYSQSVASICAKQILDQHRKNNCASFNGDRTNFGRSNCAKCEKSNSIGYYGCPLKTAHSFLKKKVLKIL